MKGSLFFNLSDFINFNGLVMKIQLVKRSNDVILKHEYYDGENACFSKFEDSTSFSDANGIVGQSLKDCAEIHSSLSNYLDTMIEVINPNSGDAVACHIGVDTLEEDVSSGYAGSIAALICHNIKGIKIPDGVEIADDLDLQFSLS